MKQLRDGGDSLARLVVKILRLVPGSEVGAQPFANNSHRISAPHNPLKSRCPRYGAKFVTNATAA
jgi:hypothetical protein